jgi:hypothetical protein
MKEKKTGICSSKNVPMPSTINHDFEPVLKEFTAYENNLGEITILADHESVTVIKDHNHILMPEKLVAVLSLAKMIEMAKKTNERRCFLYFKYYSNYKNCC